MVGAITYEECRNQAIKRVDEYYPLTLWFIWYGHWIYKKNFYDPAMYMRTSL
jgi:hypothetical protein